MRHFRGAHSSRAGALSFGAVSWPSLTPSPILVFLFFFFWGRIFLQRAPWGRVWEVSTLKMSAGLGVISFEEVADGQFVHPGSSDPSGFRLQVSGCSSRFVPAALYGNRAIIGAWPDSQGMWGCEAFVAARYLFLMDR